MQYTTRFESSLGGISLTADENGLVGLRFDDAKDKTDRLSPMQSEGSLPVLDEAVRWLEIYFSGHEPDFTPTLHITGSEFQTTVYEILQTIPYGKTVTYGKIAREIADRRGLRRMSAQAVGGAVGRNRIAIIVPCHRVIGSNGSLTGFAAGTDRKAALLRLEGIEVTGLSVHRK